MPTRPAPRAALTAVASGGPSSRAETNSAMNVSDDRYITASTTGTGKDRLLTPPR